MSERDDKLAKLYARIPDVRCKGKCQEACGPIGLSNAEYQRLEERVGCKVRARTMVLQRGVILLVPGNVCPMLKDGKCSVYDIRPVICRIWGATEDLKCPHGCRPKRWLTRQESTALLKEAEVILSAPQTIKA